MPKQTTTAANAHIFYKDGTKVEVMAASSSAWTDLGIINSSVSNTLNWDQSQVETANFGKLDVHIRNMTMSGGFTLGNLNPLGINEISGDMLEVVETAGTIVTTDIEDQVLSSGDWEADSSIPIICDDGTEHKCSAVPVLASVTGSVDGVLAADDDYNIVQDDNSGSGYSIILDTAGTTLTTETQDVTIVFTSFTPVASTTVYGGSTTVTLAAYAMRFTHTDGNGKIRRLELFSVNTASGAFAFNFGGANEDGIEEMPLTYVADIDTSLVDKRQLFSWTIEDGAE